ncbi:N-acetylmuramoyl-L-alanine amidase [Liberibacter crescens BT-1]|uniref:N-acetylmuramoyl-L-alanine amidase n=1 Tax=Liberibacter crescens (strain BT-1) TaxID=1215343 RepID=L0EVR3_LIBCB|nr:N-acetylmuramoyl-L-alanine amidase [Liberibacter crescens]AGA64763.1 N-acetylmuramoyl-L-alanine amidase [Liberibacter crescens BT-1]
MFFLLLIPVEVHSQHLFTIEDHIYRSIKGFSSRVRYLVLHCTQENFLDSVQILGQNGQLSAHYLVPDPSDPTYLSEGFRNIVIFNLVDEKDRAFHAGASGWEERTNLNDTSIGVEIVNRVTIEGDEYHFTPYPLEQRKAVIQLARSIIQRYPYITPTHVLAHSDIAYTRKNDPGPLFPWKELYEAGVGAWYDDQTVADFKEQIKAGTVKISKEALVPKFRKYGYAVEFTIDDSAYQQLVKAFQMHFRPEKYDGVMDSETAAILYALNHKYFYDHDDVSKSS